MVAALWIARLFVIGHDACHGSYTPNKTLNKWIGRIAFLPSLTPYSLWEIGHNLAHHGFTNLKGRDYVWTPYSPSEFARCRGSGASWSASIAAASARACIT
jgi:acyl-lipid omega-6 desaturase (Delta-12 desaturase)